MSDASTPEAAWPEGLIEALAEYQYVRGAPFGAKWERAQFKDAWRQRATDDLNFCAAWRDPKGEPAVVRAEELRAPLEAALEGWESLENRLELAKRQLDEAESREMNAWDTVAAKEVRLIAVEAERDEAKNDHRIVAGWLRKAEAEHRELAEDGERLSRDLADARSRLEDAEAERDEEVQWRIRVEAERDALRAALEKIAAWSALRGTLGYEGPQAVARAALAEVDHGE